jgi:hypothetical protein
MSGLPWGKFWWKDWLTDPALSVCSLAAQGLWMRMLCIMSMSDPPGHLIIPPTTRHESEAKQVARMCLADARQVRALLGELETRRVFSRDEAGSIISRRMIRDAELSVIGRDAASKGWAKRRGQPKGQPNADNGTGESKGSHERNPSARPDAYADSPPRPPRRSRHKGKGSRNGFTDIASDMIREHTDAEADDARPGGARVVDLSRHLGSRKHHA